MAITWQAFHPNQELKTSEVHLITTALSEQQSIAEPYWPLLSEDEKARANQFRFTKHRSHFVMARGILRQILSYYYNTAPNKIQFRYEEYGKPFLADQAFSSIQFNLSHSDGIALYAVTLQHPIGVDIEIIKPCDELELAKRFFAPAEYTALLALPPNKRLEGFFQLWTQKEAFIKAIGTGLFQALDRFSVSTTGPGKLLDCLPESGPVSAWHLSTFSYEKFQAAFATKQTVSKVYYWQFQDKLS